MTRTLPLTLDPQDFALCAEITHEANRAYCRTLGDLSHQHWAEAPEWQRQSALQGVRGVFEGASPEESHKNWTAHKIQEGWVYGPVKDSEAKTHPCLVAFEQLPPAQRMKDQLFVRIATAVLTALGERP